VTALLLLVLLPACGDTDDRGDARPRTSAGAASGTIRPPDDAGTRPAPPDEAAIATLQGGEWRAGDTTVEHTPRETALLREVRVAAHDGFDRIVFDFGASALPAYRIAYVDRPVRACGSGEVVELPGEAWLSIDMRPAAAHDDDGHATVRSRDLPLDMAVLRRLRSTCDFEAIVEWVAAASSPNRYRVLELEAPNRLVVDVRHE
jgi:hypothetical protein